MLEIRYCKACGHTPISKEVERQLIKLSGILVGSVGCSVALPNLFEIVDAVSAAHGRSLSVATALKMCLPDKTIISYAGDGDCCFVKNGFSNSASLETSSPVLGSRTVAGVQRSSYLVSFMVWLLNLRRSVWCDTVW